MEEIDIKTKIERLIRSKSFELNLKGTSSRLQSIIEIQTEKNKDSI